MRISNVVTMFLLRSVLFLSFCDIALAQLTGTFTPTGNMVTPRFGAHDQALADGKVLIAGGQTPRCCAYLHRFFPAQNYETRTRSKSQIGTIGEQLTIRPKIERLQPNRMPAAI